jgi:hypothetical protein
MSLLELRTIQRRIALSFTMPTQLSRLATAGISSSSEGQVTDAVRFEMILVHQRVRDRDTIMRSPRL